MQAKYKCHINVTCPDYETVKKVFPILGEWLKENGHPYSLSSRDLIVHTRYPMGVER